MQNILTDDRETTDSAQSWDLQRLRDYAMLVIMAGVVILLALWIYAAWLDVQPPERPKVWYNRAHGAVCYYTRDNLFCVKK